MTKQRIKLIANFLLFQLGWFACVLGGNSIAIFAVTTIITIHLLWVGSWHREKQLLAVTFLLGGTIDSFLGNLNILKFSSNLNDSPALLPLWLACLWLLFATTLRHSLDWTRRHKAYGALAGFICGPLTYIAGARLSDIGLAQPTWQTLLILAIIWSLLIPLLQSFSDTWLAKAKKQNLKK